MKKLLLLCMLLPCLVSAQKIGQYKMREAGSLRAPVITDSVNSKKAPYGASNMLDAAVSIDMSYYPTTTLVADTAGYVELAAPAEGASLYLLEAKIRPDSYMSGKLKVESDAMYEVFVDGVSRARKDTADDSICASSVKNIDLVMLPATEHVITVKIVSEAAMERNPKLLAELLPNEGYDGVKIAVNEGKRLFELRDLAIGEKVSRVSISPDGKYMMLVYTDAYAKDKSNWHATLTDLKTGAVINNNVSYSYRWMPKGSTLYYTVKVKDGFDVMAVEVPSMHERVIARGVPKREFSWSPTEDYVLYYTEDDNSPAPSALRHYSDPDDRIPGNRDRMIANIYDLRTGVAQPLTFGSRQANVADISPDGKKMIFTVADYDATEWPFYFVNLYELELATMKVDTLVTHGTEIGDFTYSPDGKSLFIVGGPSAFDGIGLNAGGHPIPNDTDMQGFIMDIATRSVRAMTRDFNPSLTGSPVWNAADNRIYFLAENGFNNTLYSLDPKTGDIKTFDQDITYIQKFSIGNEESRWLAYYGQSYDTNGRAYLVDLKSGKQTLVADPWHTVAETIDWGKTQRWCFTASDGTEIEGFITYPPGFDPDKKYPMIVYYYGGTSPTKHNTYSPYNAQLFASRGYVVYQLNPSGTTGYGQEFSARHVNAWGDYTAKDIIEGVTKLCAEYPWINKDKIGCIGASYGGFMTEYLLTQTDLFAAAVSHAGISNVTSYWGEGYWGYSYNALAAAKSYPWTHPDLFTKHGALFNADKIHTPLLMTHGSADTNVPVGESIQLFNALKILGRDVELVTVADEDHYISGYDNRTEWQNTIMAWFAKWLQDNPNWWESLQ